MKRYIFFIIVLIQTFVLFSQEQYTQTIKGTVVDKQSQIPLPGVNVVLLNSSPVKGTATDANGKFKLTDVPVGRVSLQFTFLGYQPVILNNLILTAGKELVLNIEMEENIQQLKEVTIVGEDEKTTTLNKMASVSARMFTVEESKRYAGSFGDPARMAANYAGVSSAGADRNDIIIRGNSPASLLWRLEGINIPNPNHFGSLGTSGGAVSILNNNLLANSDFFTGAFPAEYGNTVSGVFDLNMRTGNNEKYEFIGQIGFNGFELAAEGPLAKKGSFLASYRYSTLAVFEKLGMKFNIGGTPQYQDLSFKIDYPSGMKFGRFTIFGVGGLSYIELLSDKRDNETRTLGANYPSDIYFNSDMGVLGFSHLLFFSKSLRGKFVAALSGARNKVKLDSLYSNGNEKISTYGNSSTETTYSFSYKLTKKVNAKNTIDLGINADIKSFNYQDSSYIKTYNQYIKLLNFSGNGTLIQNYIQWQHKFSNILILNSGFHTQFFTLNNSKSFEPRAGIKWFFHEKQSLNIGAGIHSQLQPMPTYFYQTNGVLTNKNLDFTRAGHIVLGYDLSLSKNIRFKAESYYQHLYNVPVESHPSTFSGLNNGANFVLQQADSLVNRGTGKNYGLELTLEKFLSKNYYFLITASLFDSKYTGSDGIERNTAFNSNWMLNVLGGAEFNLDKNGKNVISFNIKLTTSGGNRYIPINLEESILAGKTVLDYSRAYEPKYPEYFRSDLKIMFRNNRKKITQEWAIDILNLTDAKNIFQQTYDAATQSIRTEYQQGFFPVGTYRILF